MIEDCFFILTTVGLLIREFLLDDWPAMQRIGGHPSVAPTLATVTSPWVDVEVKTWSVRSLFRGRPGFRAAIVLSGVGVIGSLGLDKTPGPENQSCAYFIDPAYWGQGYATEALWCFLKTFGPRFDLSEIGANHFEDNPASGAVLRKLGFKKSGSGMAKSQARLEPAPVTLYRLKLEELKA
jgi:RimJ/RimL family protein N-acetyltransferase